jgi:hypothetical protein
VEVIELYPNVVVYRGLYQNPEEVAKHYRDSAEWAKWFTFGELTTVKARNHTFSKFPDADEWHETMVASQGLVPAAQEIMGAFYTATSHYHDNYFNEEIPNWKFSAPAICMYKTDGGADTNVGMFYHTDFQQERADAPGDKPVMTCTMYLNDNYEGGEICFKVLNEEGTDVDFFIHKPQAGDVLVFPSRAPYYHGVNKTTSGQKYFVRSFWQYYSEGTQEWRDGLEKYGPTVWGEMEKERERVERNSGRYNLKGIDH